jgi:hypothetical protein
VLQAGTQRAPDKPFMRLETAGGNVILGFDSLDDRNEVVDILVSQVGDVRCEPWMAPLVCSCAPCCFERALPLPHGQHMHMTLPHSCQVLGA